MKHFLGSRVTATGKAEARSSVRAWAQHAAPLHDWQRGLRGRTFTQVHVGRRNAGSGAGATEAAGLKDDEPERRDKIAT